MAISILSAALTPLVAVFGLWIAGAQWWLSKKRLKLELFDRRWEVFQALRGALGKYLQNSSLSFEDIAAFTYKTFGARWLFDEEISDYLAEVQSHLLKSQRKLPWNVSEAEVEKREEVLVWLDVQIRRADKVFAPYMQIDESFSSHVKRGGRRLYQKIWGRYKTTKV